MKKLNGKRRGFTLVELVIVIAVVAILAAILIPTFSAVIKNANVAKYRASVNSMNTQLVSEAAATGVDYYTISTVRQVLIDSNFDLDNVPEGYSLWYDQSNFNLRFLENQEVKKLYEENSSSGTVTAAVGSIAGRRSAVELSSRTGASATKAPMSFGNGSVANLPYRPEALTPDPNLLFLATSQKDGNEAIAQAIDDVYNNNIGDFSKVYYAISSFLPADSAFVSARYAPNFASATTAYVNAAGELTIPTGGEIKNIVVSKLATSVTKIVKDEEVTLTSVACALEFPEYISKIPETVISFFKDATFVVGKECEIGDGNYTATIVRPNRGQEVVTDKVIYEAIQLTESEYSVAFTAYYARKQGGMQTAEAVGGSDEVVTEAELDAWWANGKDGDKMYFSKYAAPVLNLDVSAIIKKHFSNGIESLTVREICYADWSKIRLVATYWENGILKGRTFEAGIGYVTNLSAHTTSTADGTEGKKSYTPADGTTLPGEMGLTVELPAEALSYLNAFKPENLEVTVDYQVRTNVYKKQFTAFGTEYYELLAAQGGYGAVQTNQSLTWRGSQWEFSVNGSAYAAQDTEGEMLYYEQSLYLNRVVVKDKDGTILLVRYFNEAVTTPAA